METENNTEALPKWLLKNYSKLWIQYKDKEFVFENATKALNIPKERCSVILSELRKKGWISVDLDKKDTRKRIYNLRSPETGITKLNFK